mgnify:CR=1 FL=1
MRVGEEDNITDFIANMSYNHYDINGLIRDIKEYVEYAASIDMEESLLRAKLSFITQNFNFPNQTAVAIPINEYTTTGTLSAANYPSIPSNISALGTLKP